jgi:hypothetical protein
VEAMLAAETFGNEDLERLIQQLGSVVAEEPFRLQVDENDASFLIDYDNAIGSGLNEGAKDNIALGQKTIGHYNSFSRGG